jgi:hypothetical protein
MPSLTFGHYLAGLSECHTVIGLKLQGLTILVFINPCPSPQVLQKVKQVIHLIAGFIRDPKPCSSSSPRNWKIVTIVLHWMFSLSDKNNLVL